MKYRSGRKDEKTTKKTHKKTPELKASPKGEPRTWFSHPKMHPGGVSGPLGSKTPPHGPKTPLNHDFGTILEVFWTYFARIFGVMLEVFLMKNVVLPAWELIFQKFRRISWLLFCWRAFQK